MRLFSYAKILHFHFKLLTALTSKLVDQRQFWETNIYSASPFATFSNQRLSCSKVPHRALFIHINAFWINEGCVADKWTARKIKGRAFTQIEILSQHFCGRNEENHEKVSQDIPLLSRGSIRMPPENEGLLSTRPPFCTVSWILSLVGKNKVIFLVEWCIKTSWRSRSIDKWELNCIHFSSYNLLQMCKNDKLLLKFVIYTCKQPQ